MSRVNVIGLQVPIQQCNAGDAKKEIKLSLNLATEIGFQMALNRNEEQFTRKKETRVGKDAVLKVGFIGLGMVGQGKSDPFHEGTTVPKIVMGADQDPIRFNRRGSINIPMISSDPHRLSHL